MARPFEFSDMIARERKERLELWGPRFKEPHDVEPVYIGNVEPGSICRLWWMPNQSRFVVVGRIGEAIKIVLPSGSVSGFREDALVVVLDGPPATFESSLIDRIDSFERGISMAAWVGRDPDANY